MNPIQFPAEVYATFCSVIDTLAVQWIMNGISVASQNNVERVHLLFESTGGNVGDGICLYNFFKTCPIGLSIYNAGTVASIAAVAYLGAETRVVSKHATFMVHPSTNWAQAVNTAERLKTAIESLRIDDARTTENLRKHLEVSKSKWSKLRYNELWFTAQDALASGLATEIGEFAPPQGAKLYNL